MLSNLIDTRTKKLALAFVLLNILDAPLTLVVKARGGHEVNPVINALLRHSIWAFWLFKVSGASAFALCLVLASNRFPDQAKRILTILVFAVAVICVFNLAGAAI